MGQRSEMGKLIRAIRRAGCSVEQPRRGGHWKITTPDGQLIIAAFSPRSQRAIINTKQRLRAAGIKI